MRLRGTGLEATGVARKVAVGGTGTQWPPCGRVRLRSLQVCVEEEGGVH